MLATQQPTKVINSKFYSEPTDRLIDCQLHETVDEVKIYSDNALLATIQKVADGYKFDGYVFGLFLELMDYILTGNDVIVLSY
jgi:hypothetical protein